MLKNWTKIFLFQIKQNKLFATLNILGLSIAISSVIFSFLYWNHENAYDKWNPEKENVYQIINKMAEGDLWSNCPYPLAINAIENPKIVTDYLFVNSDYDRGIIKYKSKKIIDYKGININGNFFDFFPFKIIQGNSKNIFKVKNTVAIEVSLAKGIFGNENPIGKSIEINKVNYTIRAIYQLTKPSSVAPNFVYNDYLVRHQTNDGSVNTNWGDFNSSLLLKLNPKSNQNQLEQYLNNIYFEKKTKKDVIGSNLSIKEYDKSFGIKVITQKLEDLRLNAAVKFQLPEGSTNREMLNILIGISLLIFFLSAINFINLNTANAIKRAKEIGVRKIVGASKKWIVIQFAYESLLFTILSSIIAMSLVEITLPFFNELIDNHIEISFSKMITIISLSTVFLIIFAGIIPGIYISSFDSNKVLKGSFINSKNGIWIRNSLLVIQFVITSFFIISSYTINNQIQFMNNKNLGFDGKQVLYIENTRDFKKYLNIKSELKKIPGIEEVSTFEGNFNYGTNSSSGFNFKGKQIISNNFTIDESFLQMMKIPLKSGRYLTNTISSDTISNCMINETMAKQMGFKNPINQIMPTGFGDAKGNNITFKIVGVVKDFHLGGFKNNTKPLLIIDCRTLKWNNSGPIFIKFDPSKLEEILPKIEKIYQNKINPDLPFEYNFVNKSFAKTYQDSKKQNQLFNILNIFVIIISIFGLYALASFSMQRRMKEIAIRQVLGAKTFTLIKNLSIQYIYFTLIGFAISILPAYYFLQNWLKDFVFKIDLNPTPFVIAIVLMLLLTLGIVLLKSIQITKLNLLSFIKSE